MERESWRLAQGMEEILREDRGIMEEDGKDRQEQTGGGNDESRSLSTSMDFKSDMSDENDAPMGGLVGMLRKLVRVGNSCRQNEEGSNEDE